jgi:zinc D-Ala-D-Ala dipeptidase
MADRLRDHLMEIGAKAGESDTADVPQGLVDVRETASGLILLPAPPWSDPELRYRLRPEVADRLLQASLALPDGIRLGFWEGLRPRSIQRTLWDAGLAFLRGSYGEMGQAELEEALERYVARPDDLAPPHSTGSAVDVAPVDAFGRVLAPSDAWGWLAVEAMARALRSTGLANYQPEWWHWSYGDAEWARAYDCAPLAFAVTPEFDGPGGGI